MPIAASELILNSYGSFYPLNLQFEGIVNTTITIGNPDCIAEISMHFNPIEIKKEKREFHAHVGILNGKRLIVYSLEKITSNIS